MSRLRRFAAGVLAAYLELAEAGAKTLFVFAGVSVAVFLAVAWVIGAPIFLLATFGPELSTSTDTAAVYHMGHMGLTLLAVVAWNALLTYPLLSGVDRALGDGCDD